MPSGIRIRQRSRACRARHIRNDGGAADSISLGFNRYRRLDSGFFVCRSVYVGHPHLQPHRKALGIQDYGGIVWDEMVAMLLILAFAPFKWNWWLAAFILFRLFDSIKPWPIKWFDRHVHGGFGIMLDDIIAAIMTLIVLGIAAWII